MRIMSAGYRIQGTSYRILSAGYMAWGMGLTRSIPERCTTSLRLRVQGLGLTRSIPER
jgi:hypothetical protein